MKSLFSADGTQDPQVHPAATVVLVRPRGSEGIEVFMVKRHRKSAFMGAFHVFPGGRVDAADHRWAATLGPDAHAHALHLLDGVDDALEATAFALAAIRETAEECGVLLARDAQGQLPHAHVAEAVFDGLKGGADFRELLAHQGLRADLPSLQALGWWITPPFEKRRYDTRFYLAEAPQDQHASYDAYETTAGLWTTPQEALDAYRHGDIFLAPPTMATLELLREAASPAALLEGLKRPIQPILPHLCTDPEGRNILALPGDPLFPETRPAALPHRTRFEMKEGRRFV